MLLVQHGIYLYLIKVVIFKLIIRMFIFFNCNKKHKILQM